MRLTYRTYSLANGVQKIKTRTGIVVTAMVLALGSGGGLALGMFGTAHAAPVTTITQADQQGWTFFDDNGHGGSGEFVSGPGTPPIGTGSAELDLTTAAGDQGYALGYDGYGGTKLSDINGLTYSTYVQQGNNLVAPALQLNIDSDLTDGNTAWQGRLVYEPYLTHTVTDGTWQTWNTQDNAADSNGHGNWWLSNSALAASTGCAQSTPCTWQQVLAQLPHGGINSAVPGVVFKAGSGWNVQFKGNVDAFTINVKGAPTSYNFDYRSCTTVATSKGSMTAAQVGGNVSGNLNAVGCDIGVYYNHSHTGQVTNASIHDANQYGVFVDGMSGNVAVNTTKSHVYNIGTHTAEAYTPNGVQTGVGIYYNSVNSTVSPSVVTPGRVQGKISGNTVDDYQKGGIVANGSKTDADTDSNVVTGAGPVDYIAQNGIQMSRGAMGGVTNNTVAANAYTGAGTATSAGVLVYGGLGDPLTEGITVDSNKLIDNDVAVNFANYNADGSGQASSATKNVAANNWIFSSKVTNTTGLVAANGNFGYQAGIEDVGDRDSACGNTILGPGYVDEGSFDSATNTATPGADNAVVRDIDAGYTFPTTDFSTCHDSHNYGGGHFNQDFFKLHDKRSHHWWF